MSCKSVVHVCGCVSVCVCVCVCVYVCVCVCHMNVDTVRVFQKERFNFCEAQFEGSNARFWSWLTFMTTMAPNFANEDAWSTWGVHPTEGLVYSSLQLFVSSVI